MIPSLLSIAALLFAAPAAAPAPLPAPARLQVGADEFHFVLSRGTLRSGDAILELVNYGEDDHDLRLRRSGGTRTYRVAAVRPGGLKRLETKLAPGRFLLWCSLSDHRSRGMTARLDVRG